VVGKRARCTNDIINQPQNSTELLRIMTGYGQRASLFSLYTPSIPNVLLQMKKDYKSDYTIGARMIEPKF
jgi:hypothetical protein